MLDIVFKRSIATLPKNCDDIKKEPKPPRYTNVDKYLEAAMSEYQYDIDLVNNLYSRVGIIVVILLAYIGYLYNNILDISLLLTSPKATLAVVIVTMYVFFFIASLVLLVISSKNFLKVIFVASYDRIDISSGFDKELLETQEEVNTYRLMLLYRDIVNENIPIVKKKVSSYENGMKYFVSSIIAYALYQILLQVSIFMV